ncbi:MAG: hypothetical protein NT049_02155 [Planctomycetota bacterium]|nr:hypothetical protein [Planctomycetota bacterium]
MLKYIPILSLLLLSPAAAADAPEVPRIDYVIPSPRQPQENDAATIWYDDFNGPPKAYTESSGDLDEKVSLGGEGKSMRCLYEKGEQGKGNRKVFFGDSPTGKVVRKGETFTDVYWRIYVKHQYGWTGGGPDKMSRATSMDSSKWNQAMISHVWSSGEALTLDPASGVRGSEVVTTKYNDFDKLHWLGNKPASTFLIHATSEAGRWVCVEVRAKLNTPGQKDGLNQLWIDGRLEAERKNLDWRGSYTGHGINALFLEAYWNKGSPVTQERWYDNFVIATKPIGPVTCPRNPVLVKTPYHGPGEMAAWEAQVAADPDGQAVVWASKPVLAADRVTVDKSAGAFSGPLAGKTALAPAATYWCRARQQSKDKTWSAWSPWHQAIATEKE